MSARALGATVYLTRCARRVLPAWTVIALVTMLLVALLTPSNTFRHTSAANVRALQAFTVVGAYRDAHLSRAQMALLDGDPHLERRVACRALWIRYPMLVGEAVCALILVDEAEVRELMQRVGLTLASGRMPRPGGYEILLHEDVARARGVVLGDRIGMLTDPDDSTPGSFEIVGTVRGAARLGLGAMAPPGVLGALLDRFPEFQLVYARPGSKAASDEYLRAAREGDRPAFQVVDDAAMERRIARALRNLPVMVRFVALASSLVVALVVTLLYVIVFQSRADEFAILLVIGHGRARLLRRLAVESIVLALSGWIAGVALGTSALLLYRGLWLEPRGILVGIPDPGPILVSGLLPLLSVIASLAVAGRRLARMDPIAVIQRRSAS